MKGLVDPAAIIARRDHLAEKMAFSKQATDQINQATKSCTTTIDNTDTATSAATANEPSSESRCINGTL